MKFKKLKVTDSKEFNEAWNIYKNSFPSDERRTLKSQQELIKNNQYSFFKVTKDEALVAIIAIWNFQDFLFIEHLAAKKEMRGKGIGTELLKEYLSKSKKQIVLEVERPKNEIANKRIEFYKKIGFKLNDFDYIQPSYGIDKKPIPLLLMTYPKRISDSEFQSIRKKLHTIVYELDNPLIAK